MTSSIMAISDIQLYFTYITVIGLYVMIITFSTIEQMAGVWTLQVFFLQLTDWPPTSHFFSILPRLLSRTERTGYILITNVALSDQ